MLRTSRNNPLRVSWITGKPAAFGITLCPGKRIPGRTGSWARDLDLDLARLRSFGVNTLVSLLPDSELATLRVPNLPARCGLHALRVLRYPIADRGVPTNVDTFGDLLDRIVDELLRSRRVVAHCRGGEGRAGLLAACLLVRLEVFRNPAAAIAHVRAKRGPPAVETPEQEAFVRRYLETRGWRSWSDA